MNAKPFDVLVAGEINPDLILSGDVTPEFDQVEKLVDADIAIGSSSAIFACGAARLGLKVSFIGKCGDDLFGRYMLDEMKQHGIETGPVIIVPGGTTGLTVILNRGSDRAIFTHAGLIDSLRAEDIPAELLAQSRHLHVASYFLQKALQPGLPGLFRRAHSLGLTTSLDTNYDPSEKWLGFDELLAQTDVFLPNETEACSLTGQENIETAAGILSGKVGTTAIKLGARGVLGVHQSQMIMVPSIPVTVIDTVGAGDSFDAGFIYGYLNDLPFEDTLRLAVTCGSLSTQKAGGTAAQLTLEQALHESA